MITKDKKAEIITNFGANKVDSGSTEVQIALLDAKIKDLNKHFTEHKKDHLSRKGLLKMVSRRKKLLEYLKKHNLEKYRELVEKLGIRK